MSVLEANSEWYEGCPTQVCPPPLREAPADPWDQATCILKDAYGERSLAPLLTMDCDSGVSEIDVTVDPFFIGRSADCDLVISDAKVSRQHAAIERHQDGWYLVDGGSQNGTFLNGKRVTEALLADGDVIEIADAEITFSTDEEPPRETPVRGDSTRVFQGTDRRTFLIAAGVTAAVVVLFSLVLFWPSPDPAPQVSEAAVIAREADRRVAEAESDFAKVKQLARQGQWEDANRLMGKVARVLGGRAEVDEYAVTIGREAKAERLVLQANLLVERDDIVGALAALGRVPPNTTQVDAVQALRDRARSKALDAKLRKAQEALAAGDPESAQRLIAEILMADPDNVPAKALRERVAVASKPKPDRRRRRRKTTPRRPATATTVLTGEALVAYREGDLDRAIANDPAASGKLRAFSGHYKRCRTLAANIERAKEAVACLQKARRTDRALAGGGGKIATDLSRQLARLLFLQGVDAQRRGDYPTAFGKLRAALKIRPDLEHARTALARLDKEAVRLYETAYVLRPTQPETSLKHCKTVLRMTRPRAYSYGRCKKLIATIQAPSTYVEADTSGF